MKWTKAQQLAIDVAGSDTLVAAAAGSGKTAVLVERLIKKMIAPEHPLSVDELLIVTFTNKSAAEMRGRIGEALEKACALDPTNTHLQKQIALLSSASISTLHSFCLEVVRKYATTVELDPSFRLGDVTELSFLREEVLEDVLEAAYGEEDEEKREAFYKFVDAFTSDRGDEEIRELVQKLYEFSRAHPEPARFLQQVVAVYDREEDTSFDELPYAGLVRNLVERNMQATYDLLQKGLKESEQWGVSPLAETFATDVAALDTLIERMHGDWALFEEGMRGFKFPKAKPVKKGVYDDEAAEKLKAVRQQAKKLLEGIQESVFQRSLTAYLRDGKAMVGIIQELNKLVESFGVAYWKAKKERSVLDFSDLEHLTIQLFQTTDENGQKVPSPVAVNYRNRFAEILVDEYQDTNLVQETILRCIKQGDEASGNLFMVGDVKQSIYRFRLAEPTLFLDKYRRFTAADDPTAGTRIDLSQNFRSRKDVLEATNFVFSQIMGERVGEIVYDEAASLQQNTLYPEEEMPVDVVILEEGGEAEVSFEREETKNDEDPSEWERARLESEWIAEKIASNVANRVHIFDAKRGADRPVQFRDHVVLLRSMTWAEEVSAACKRRGIPVYANSRSGYFEATEVQTMLSLLHIIDNPYQDIPFASVLRSPIVEFTEEELAQIRVLSRKSSFYDAFCEAIAHPKADGTAWQEKGRWLLQHLNEWRAFARKASLSDLIWRLYRDTRYVDFVGGLVGGKQRQANLRALYDRARSYEKTAFRGLFRFLRFIGRLQERNEDLGTARAVGEEENVVRIMTIHSSKGLEFPHVFVAGLGKQFNRRDMQGTYLFDAQFGFATKYIDVEKRFTRPSLFQQAIREKKQGEMLAEEMRVLYVAMTRAKEKLYLLGSVKSVESSAKKWTEGLEGEALLLPEYKRAQAVSYLDWIVPAFLRHPLGKKVWAESTWCQTTPMWETFADAKVDITFSWLTPENFASEGEAVDGELFELPNDGERVEKESPFTQEVFAQLEWTYEHEWATRLKSKQSVSELKRWKEWLEAGDVLDGPLVSKPRFDRPKFLQENKVSPTERGTLMHLVMQHVPIHSNLHRAEIETVLENMVRKHWLTDDQKEVIEIDWVLQFFSSSIGKRVVDSDNVKREIPFSYTVPARELHPDVDGEGESVLIQGIVDCLIEEEDGFVLVDYKTDTITGRYPGGFEEAKPHLLERYREQVYWYARAIGVMLDKPVKESVLYFFDGGHVVDVAEIVETGSK